MRHEGTGTKASGKLVTVAGIVVGLLSLFMIAAPGAFASVSAPAATMQVASHNQVYSPLITATECTSDLKNWLHVYTTVTPFCFGYKGTASLSGNSTHRVCAGNNEGSIYYYDVGENDYDTWDFNPGNNFYSTDGIDVVEVTITGWSGSATCPTTYGD